MSMMNITEYFDAGISPQSLENSGQSRLSENAMWLLNQRYFVQRYDSELKGNRQENNFEEFARRVSRTVALDKNAREEHS